MQLFEVKNDIAKIIYNPAENHLLPYDFLLIEDVNSNTFAVFSGSEDQVKFVLDKLIKWICDSDDSIFYIKDVHKQYVDAIAEFERYKEQ